MKPSLLIALLGLSACASLTPRGEGVLRVSDAAVVNGCKPVGDVKATPPYGLPDDWEKQLRNQAAELGGDTVLAASPGLTPGSVSGKAYLCHPRP